MARNASGWWILPTIFIGCALIIAAITGILIIVGAI